MSHKDYKAIIKPFLSEKRYQHSLAVADEAARLAKKYGANEKKAYTAGILHDIMKDMPPKEQMKLMTKYDIILTEVERSGQKLWHAMLGAAYVENELRIEDQEVLNAIRYHTTGRAHMLLLEKVLFVADFTSSDRDYPGVEDMRRAAEHGLLEALLHGMTYTIQDLTDRRLAIHPDSISAYNEAVLEYQSII